MEIEHPMAHLTDIREQERLINMLEDRLEINDDNKKDAQEKLYAFCNNLRAQIDELEDKISKELEEKYNSEDARLQAALNDLNKNDSFNALKKAKAELLVMQSYKIIENNHMRYGSRPNLNSLYELKTEKHLLYETMEIRKPTNVCVTKVSVGRVFVMFTCLNPDEERVLFNNGVANQVRYRCSLFKKDNEQEYEEYLLAKDCSENDVYIFTPDVIEPETAYGIRVKMIVGDRESDWSDVIADFVTSPEFNERCIWKNCPGDVCEWRKYSVDEKNLRVATKIDGNGNCTIIGNTYIPKGIVTSWSIKIIKSWNNDGYGTYVGVTTFDISQNGDNHYKCGWYFHCYESALISGPPYNFRNKVYGPRKEKSGQYVHTGDSVGVVMDTIKGEISFVLGGVDCGVAYGEVPLDKPLVPCVLLSKQGDSVEFEI